MSRGRIRCHLVHDVGVLSRSLGTLLLCCGCSVSEGTLLRRIVAPGGEDAASSYETGSLQDNGNSMDQDDIGVSTTPLSACSADGSERDSAVFYFVRDQRLLVRLGDSREVELLDYSSTVPNSADWKLWTDHGTLLVRAEYVDPQGRASAFGQVLSLDGDVRAVQEFDSFTSRWTDVALDGAASLSGFASSGPVVMTFLANGRTYRFPDASLAGMAVDNEGRTCVALLYLSEAPSLPLPVWECVGLSRALPLGPADDNPGPVLVDQGFLLHGRMSSGEARLVYSRPPFVASTALPMGSSVVEPIDLVQGSAVLRLDTGYALFEEKQPLSLVSVSARLTPPERVFEGCRRSSAISIDEQGTAYMGTFSSDGGELLRIRGDQVKRFGPRYHGMDEVVVFARAGTAVAGGWPIAVPGGCQQPSWAQTSDPNLQTEAFLTMASFDESIELTVPLPPVYARSLEQPLGDLRRFISSNGRCVVLQDFASPAVEVVEIGSWPGLILPGVQAFAWAESAFE